ncbi:MAG: hypothetical protein WBX25_34845 [Rhodomicrobium sp.]
MTEYVLNEWESSFAFEFDFALSRSALPTAYRCQAFTLEELCMDTYKQYVRFGGRQCSWAAQVQAGNRRVDFAICLLCEKGYRYFVIELDGQTHDSDEQRSIDRENDILMQLQGITVLRLRYQKPDGVSFPEVETIVKALGSYFDRCKIFHSLTPCRERWDREHSPLKVKKEYPHSTQYTLDETEVVIIGIPSPPSVMALMKDLASRKYSIYRRVTLMFFQIGSPPILYWNKAHGRETLFPRVVEMDHIIHSYLGTYAVHFFPRAGELTCFRKDGDFIGSFKTWWDANRATNDGSAEIARLHRAWGWIS